VYLLLLWIGCIGRDRRTYAIINGSPPHFWGTFGVRTHFHPARMSGLAPIAPASGPHYEIQEADYKWSWEGTMNGPRPTVQRGWARLEGHFAHHASLVDRFSAAGPSAVLGMVQSGRN
jgi:hypothetical protein